MGLKEHEEEQGKKRGDVNEKEIRWREAELRSMKKRGLGAAEMSTSGARANPEPIPVLMAPCPQATVSPTPYSLQNSPC